MRRNDHDVTNTVCTTDAMAVGAEVQKIYGALYGGAPPPTLGRAFEHAARLYAGRDPAYHACETPFHDQQHALETTLAMARLMDGYARGRVHGPRLRPAVYRMGVVCALFHGIGFLRRRRDHRHAHGAEYTLTRAARSARFLQAHLRGEGLARYAGAAAHLVHYTGHERPAEAILVDSGVLRRVGQMLGTAELLAQMSDRCFLEKRRDRLYAELVAGRLAGPLVRTAAELVRRSHAFCLSAAHRMELQLARAYEFAARHFDGQNLYLDAMQRNAAHALVLVRAGGHGQLRRVPPMQAVSSSAYGGSSRGGRSSAR